MLKGFRLRIGNLDCKMGIVVSFHLILVTKNNKIIRLQV